MHPASRTPSTKGKEVPHVCVCLLRCTCNPSLHPITLSPRTSQEEDEEDRECSVNEQRFLLACHAVGAQPVLLVLRKPSDNLQQHTIQRHTRTQGGQQTAALCEGAWLQGLKAGQSVYNTAD